MTAYKDITPEQMTLLARTIVDQSLTKKQKECKHCHNIPDFDASPDEAFNSEKPHEDELYKFIIKLIDKAKNGGRSDALIKSNGLYYHVHISMNGRVMFDLIEYCEHCGRRLDIDN